MAHVACQLVLVLRAVLTDHAGKNVDAGFVHINLMAQELPRLGGSVGTLTAAVVAADIGRGEVATGP